MVCARDSQMPKSFEALLAEDRAYTNKFDAKTMESDFNEWKAVKAQYEALKKDLDARCAALHEKYHLCFTCQAKPVPPERVNCACCIDDARG